MCESKKNLSGPVGEKPKKRPRSFSSIKVVSTYSSLLDYLYSSHPRKFGDLEVRDVIICAMNQH
jgi:hypothetical protein